MLLSPISLIRGPLKDDTGWLSPGVGAASNFDGGSNSVWNNPGRVVASDDSRSDSSLSPFQSSEYIHGTSYGISLPAGSTIDGVEVRIEAQSDLSADIDTLGITLVKGGSKIGTQKTTAVGVGPSDAYFVLGSPTDLWGAGLTQSDVEDSSFGVAFEFFNGNSSLTGSAFVDHIQIKVYYTH